MLSLSVNSSGFALPSPIFLEISQGNWTFILWIIQKSYETKQYKKGLKAADQILKKFPDHGGMSIFFFFF